MDITSWSREDLERAFLELDNILRSIVENAVSAEDRLKILGAIKKAQTPKEQDLGISKGILSLLDENYSEDELPPVESELPFHLTVMCSVAKSTFSDFNISFGVVRFICFESIALAEEFHATKVNPDLKHTIYYKTVKTEELTEFLSSNFSHTKVEISFYSDIKKEPSTTVLNIE